MMLPFKFSPFLFLRSPSYSIDDFGQKGLQELLAEKFFRTALYFSSPALYRQVKSKDFDASRLTKGAAESLMKYYNRMSWRSTPFGMFSAFSDTKWDPDNIGLTFTGRDQLHIQVDYRLSQIISANARADAKSETFYSNPSIYTLGKELRYIKAGRNGDTAESSHGISVVEGNSLLSKLMSISRTGIGREEVTDLLSSRYSEEDADALLEELQSEELFFSDLMPNVTGPNYLERIGSKLGDERILMWIKTLASFRDPASVNLVELETLIRPFAERSEAIRSPLYVNYQKGVTGAVSVKYQEKLLSGLSCLARLQQEGERGAIGRFKKRFHERFEEREVQLMTALDPEAGVGYEYLEETADGGELLTGITFKEVNELRTISWGPVQEMLMNKMSLSNTGHAIVLTDADLEPLPGTTKPVSPGISVMFRICGEKTFIETAGGATATALIGRFTSISDDVLAHARALADAEQQANPDVIFAEIAYASDEHAANINTREHIRQYEIPILVHSTLPPGQVIGLNDLYVSVRQDEIILRSGRLKRRIIPRSSTAYNHIRSELPVFRFLSDLQYQGIQTSFVVKPEELLPGRAFYQRIEYKDCILSRATWILNKQDLQRIKTVSNFLVVAKERRITRYFALSDSDKQLVFDLSDISGLELLLIQITNVQTAILREVFEEPPATALLKDARGKVYNHQLIAYLINPSRTYFPIVETVRRSKHARRYVFPGDSWIYFKIYCSSQNANNILLSKIYPLLKRHRSNIDKWFFVRYSDPEYHLRIRVRGVKTLIKEMPELVNHQLKSFTKNALISRIQIDTYAREVERYGPEAIEQAEQVFCSSSELVAEYFQSNRNETETVRFAVVSTHKILDSYELNPDQRIALLERICTNLIAEHDSQKQLKGDLNKKYREHQRALQQYMQLGTDFFRRVERQKLNMLVAELRKFHAVASRHDQSAADMLHMHMNRIFSSDQRKKELVIYYMCLRFYISDKARAISGLP